MIQSPARARPRKINPLILNHTIFHVKSFIKVSSGFGKLRQDQIRQKNINNHFLETNSLTHIMTTKPNKGQKYTLRSNAKAKYPPLHCEICQNANL